METSPTPSTITPGQQAEAQPPHEAHKQVTVTPGLRTLETPAF